MDVNSIYFQSFTGHYLTLQDSNGPGNGFATTKWQGLASGHVHKLLQRSCVGRWHSPMRLNGDNVLVGAECRWDMCSRLSWSPRQF